jgi:hypothetical protein
VINRELIFILTENILNNISNNSKKTCSITVDEDKICFFEIINGIDVLLGILFIDYETQQLYQLGNVLKYLNMKDVKNLLNLLYYNNF